MPQVVEFLAVFLVFTQNSVQQRCKFLRNALLSGLWSRSLLVETLLLVLHVVEVLVVVFTVFLRFRAPQWIFQFLLETLMKGFFPGQKKCEGWCSLQVGTGRALIHARRLWRGEFARGAGAGEEGGRAPQRARGEGRRKACS